MIRRWTGPGLPLPETEAGIRIAGLLEAYGPDCPFVRFWQADEAYRCSLCRHSRGAVGNHGENRLGHAAGTGFAAG